MVVPGYFQQSHNRQGIEANRMVEKKTKDCHENITSPAGPDEAWQWQFRGRTPGRRHFRDRHLDFFSSEETRFQDQVGGCGGYMATHWSVPWSDLMMVMFVLFAVLFASKVYEKEVLTVHRHITSTDLIHQTIEPIVVNKKPGIGLVSSQSIYRSSQEVVKKANLENVEIVLQDDQSVKVSVQGPMFFDLGKAELRPETQMFLDSMAGVIRRTNNEIQVIGHTDSFPINTERFPSNWELAAIRATKVARYLIEHGGIDPGRITVSSHSMYKPAVPNTTSKNKSLNRRVEIIITRNEYKGDISE